MSTTASTYRRWARGHMTFLLGEDGKVHTGEADHHIGHIIMQTDCGVASMRPIGLREKWWCDMDERICDKCMVEDE